MTLKIRMVTIILFLIFSFSAMAIAYPQDQLNKCILGVKQSPIVTGVPASEIENWCNCTLELIIEEGKGDRQAANYCGHKYFK